MFEIEVGLVSALMKHNDLSHQLKQMEDYFALSSCDLLCFGESFLQGFEGLTWQYEKDIHRALTVDSPEILHIRDLSKNYKRAVSFGFFEKDHEAIYSSNMVIDGQGKVIDVFKRVSIGWKEPIASSFYQEGEKFHTFTLMGKTFGTAICGDIWHDNFLEELELLKMDALLWPIYVDFSIERWFAEEVDDYLARTQNIPCPVLLINSYVEAPDKAKGGCYVLYNNKIISSLAMGKQGILTYTLS